MMLSVTYKGEQSGQMKQYDPARMPSKPQLRQDFPKDNRVRRVILKERRRVYVPHGHASKHSGAGYKRKTIRRKSKIIDLMHGKSGERNE